MKQPWIASAKVDILGIISPSLCVVLLIFLFPNYFKIHTEVSDWWWVILILFIDVSHVYSTLFKTYFVSTEIKKHLILYIITPISCFILAFVIQLCSIHLFWRFMAYMAVFHFIRQQYGFMRLYARNEKKSIIDTIVIYAATLYPLAYWHLKGPLNFSWFVQNDFIFLNNWIFSNTILSILKIIYSNILIIYFIKEIYQFWKTRNINIPKNGVVIGTVLSWYIGIVLYNGDLIFTALNVVSHGIPYMVLIWISKNDEYFKNKSTLFKELVNKKGVILFVVTILIIAFIEELFWEILVWHDQNILFRPFVELHIIISNPVFIGFIVALLSTPQLTHYVLDAFIWKNNHDSKK